MNNANYERYYMSTKTFENYNANPMGAKKRGYEWDRADCSIRALAKGANIEWIEAFDYLTAKARRDYNVVNDGKGFRKWLVENGAVWTPCKAEKGKKRMKVLDFALAHPKGSYVIDIASHSTACVDGKIYDTWNCGESAVVGYYDMTNFHI